MNRQEQMKEMIRNEIQSISSLKDRVALKELMERVFLPLYETNEQMYQQLEERVMNDLAYDVNRYLIKTGLVERKFLDPTHHFMTVMREEDNVQRDLTVGDIRQTIARDGECLLGTVFLQCDLLDIRKVLDSADKIPGTIKTVQEIPVQTRLKQNQSYLEKVEHLYHLFMKNGVPWQTINCPYLFKLIDVYVTEVSDRCQDAELVEAFQIDIGENTSAIRYDIVPIWNVWHLKLNSTGFPTPCKDHKNYEHVISISNYGNEHIYMFDEDSGITSVRQNGHQLMITSPRNKIKEWDVYSIRSGQEGRVSQYAYPVMENLRIDGFAERFQRKNSLVVKTKGELERFIRGFGLDEYLEYKDCMLVMNGDDPRETYSMNFFMRDEVRENRQEKQLILLFAPREKNSWLTRDLMSFIVSEVQELYPEYECGGRLK